MLRSSNVAGNSSKVDCQYRIRNNHSHNAFKDPSCTRFQTKIQQRRILRRAQEIVDSGSFKPRFIMSDMDAAQVAALMTGECYGICSQLRAHRGDKYIRTFPSGYASSTSCKPFTGGKRLLVLVTELTTSSPRLAKQSPTRSPSCSVRRLGANGKRRRPYSGRRSNGRSGPKH